MRVLAPKLLALMAVHPELREYKRTLLGCCKLPQDVPLRRRLVSFALQHPKFQTLLRGMLDA